MKKVKYGIYALIWVLCALLLPGGYCHRVSAAQKPVQTDKKGSIRILMTDTDTGQTVAGGTLSCILAAKLTVSQGVTEWKYTEAFADCGLSLENIQDAEFAQKLSDFASGKKITGITQNVQSNGTAVFENLSVGLYLVVQQITAEGYDAVSPFVVTIPAEQKDGWSYDVDASPKMGTVRAEPTVTQAPSQPSEPRLPQTGQLNWPIPLLAAAGLVLMLIGWCMYRSGKEQNDR